MAFNSKKKGNAFYGGLTIHFSYLFLLLIFLKPVYSVAQSANYLFTRSANTYTLTHAAKTSAGVYTTDSVLVRTLWGAKNVEAGTYVITWDGKDNLGNTVPAGDYLFKVVANNVKYVWCGIIGNTSDSNTGSTVHRGLYYFMTGMTIVGNAAYYCSGYSEGRPSIAAFNTSHPQKMINIEKNLGTTTANTDFVASDGKLIYWAGVDAYSINNTFVFANKITDNSDFTFAGGIAYKQKHGRAYNTINYLNQENSVITGLAVQKKGNFLFVARKGLNTLTVSNKLTGNIIVNLKITAPRFMCVDANDNLWMVSDSNKICKYLVNPNGSLSDPLVTISSVLKPVAISVSPDNSTIAIADGDITSQQVKAFSTSTGAKLWELGSAGGYVNNAAVNNYKFYFNDVRGKMYAAGAAGFSLFITYQPDGSFWVNDPGNYRVQHFSAKQKYIETIMAMGPSYSTWANKNNNRSVGAEYLEFEVDNNVTLTGKTGWKLVKNWGANVSAEYDRTTKFTNVITLKSGNISRVYGFLRVKNLFYLVEFQADNTLRFTGIVKQHCNLDKNGALLTDDLDRYEFKGFDSKNDPVWSSTPQSFGIKELLQDKGPLPKEGFRNSYITSSGKVIFYDYSIVLSTRPSLVLNTGFHLGAIKKGGKEYVWKTAKATTQGYNGAFPAPEYFDIGNMVNNNAGGSAMVLTNNIITSYHGEFWKGTQTNMYNHYLDNGLSLGQFGAVGSRDSEQAPAGMAGNVLSPQLVNGNNDDEAYLFHGDESFHAGVHKWKITGLNTIKVVNIPIKYPSENLPPKPIAGNNLMIDLPYDKLLANNTSGWTISPATQQAGWSVRTNALVYGQQNNPDVYIVCRSTTGNFSVNRDLGTNSKLDTWLLKGEIAYPNTDQQGAMEQYFDVLDNKDKIIARISNVWIPSSIPGQSKNTVYGNNKILVAGLNDSFIAPLLRGLRPIEVSCVKNAITIKYAGYSVSVPAYDATADPSSPKTMRAYFTGGYNPTGRNFDFKDMLFNYTSKATPAPKSQQ